MRLDQVVQVPLLIEWFFDSPTLLVAAKKIAQQMKAIHTPRIIK